MATGWVKLYRKLSDWEWSDSPNTLSLFVHILLKANYEPSKYRGEIIPAGSFVTGRHSLSKITGLSEQQVRTALNKLLSTNEITIKTSNRYSIISVVNWDEYQEPNQDDNQQITNKQPTDNQQITTSKEVKNKRTKEYNIPDGVTDQTWQDFKRHRQAKKAPITTTVLNALQREAGKAGLTLEEVLIKCCEKNWISFKASWLENENRNTVGWKDQKRTSNAPTVSKNKLAMEGKL